MDIFLIGAAASGKTQKAEQIIAQHFGVKVIYETTLRQLYVVDQILGGRVDILREAIREARVEAVLFDGCLTSDALLAVAVQAVKEAREQTGRNLLAVYVRQTEQTLREVPAIADAAKVPAPVKKLSNEFKTP